MNEDFMIKEKEYLEFFVSNLEMKYGDEPSEKTIQIAKEKGLVIVFGYSDDLIEMRGAYEEEFNAYEGGTIRSNKERKIAAKWNQTVDDNLYSFVYETTIPHACFDVWEEGETEPYCRGIVFYALDGEGWEEIE